MLVATHALGIGMVRHRSIVISTFCNLGVVEGLSVSGPRHHNPLHASMILIKIGGRRPGAQGAGGGQVTLRIYRFLLVQKNIENFEKGRWECGGRPVGGALGPRAAPGDGTLSIPAAL